MGQKVHPKGFRLGVIEQWDSRWFARREYSELLHEDTKIRSFLKKRLYHAGVSKIEIERAANKAKINIHTARPGIIIGRLNAFDATAHHYQFTYESIRYLVERSGFQVTAVHAPGLGMMASLARAHTPRLFIEARPSVAAQRLAHEAESRNRAQPER